ncbi:MAG: acyl dehydratase [Pseudomonadota bacterium]
MNQQRYWDDVIEGDEIEPERFPLSVARLVLAVGANRDFNAIHYNTEVAQASGAPEMYANNFFLQGMWEKAIRRYIGLAGVIRKLSGFQMKSFNTAGDTVVVRGRVLRKWLETDQGYVEFEVWSENANGVSVGPGRIIAVMPRLTAR